MKHDNRKAFVLRAQSAMEYLMTYGWAILIIAVVLASLFSLGVFSGLGGPATACIPVSGYSCAAPIVLPTTSQAPGLAAGAGFSGQFTAAVGQNIGITVYNAFFTVAPQGSSLNGVGFPLTGNVFPLSATGLTLPSGATNVIYVNLNTNELITNSLSTAFTGQIWMNYSTTSGGLANQAIKIALVNVKVT